MLYDLKTKEDLGYNDFLLEDLHGVVGAAGLLPHENDFPKSAFAQKLQIVEVIHCLKRERSSKKTSSCEIYMMKQ